MKTAPLVPGFQLRLDAERDAWLRRRFRVYYLILVGASLAGTLILAQALAGAPGRATFRAGLFFTVGCAALSAWPVWLVARGRTPPVRTLLRVSYAVTSILAALLIVPSAALAEIATQIYRAQGRPAANLGPMIPWVACFLSTHSLASLILPWRPLQAFLAYAFFAGAVSLLMLFPTNDSAQFKILGFILVWVVGVPGMLICAIRQSRFARDFRLRAFGEHIAESRQELDQARAIHDALFPDPIRDGPIRMSFAYEPMRSIGGDFLYAHRRDSALSVVLIDVTGHGIPAALTVNRLHGELDRTFGECPESTPGQVLERLNSYIHFALARHSIFATAFCARVEPAAGAGATLLWASAGHPPAFIRSPEGSLRRLDSTAMALGAAPPDAFEHGEQTDCISPRESLVAYTDGAIEAADARGAMLRIEGLIRILLGVHPDVVGLPHAALDAVREFRSGPPSDDTLVVAISLAPSPA